MNGCANLLWKERTPPERQPLASIPQFAFLIGLGILTFGGMIYPPLAWPMAVFSLAFVVACIAAFAVRAFKRWRNPPNHGTQ